jgi:hypothetical protein
MAAQIIYLIILIIALMISSYRHGNYRDGQFNLWEDLIGYLIQLGLLFWGGFFDPLFN